MFLGLGRAEKNAFVSPHDRRNLVFEHVHELFPYQCRARGNGFLFKGIACVLNKLDVFGKSYWKSYIQNNSLLAIFVDVKSKDENIPLVGFYS